MEHLSPEWIDAFDQIVRAHEGLRTATADRRVAVTYVVAEPSADQADQADPGGAGDPGQEVGAAAYTVVLDHGDNRVVAGALADADVTFRTDLATAAAIMSQRESAQRAFMSGRLRLGGDVRALMANQDLLAEVDDCAAALRATTSTAPGRDA